MLLPVNHEHPEPRKISRAVEILDRGGVIIYPTDTFYGIGCDLHNKKAIKRVYEIKRHSPKQPFSFICADLKDVAKYAIVSNYAYKTMRRLLPGPYTFILKGTKLVPKMMLNKRKQVGLRVPDNPVALALVAELGRPIISTSAILDGEPMVTDPGLIHDRLGHQVDLVFDGGPQGLEPSSIISLIDDEPEVLREAKGAVDIF